MTPTPTVVVVDEEMVRRYWPNTDPIGKRVTGDDPDSPDATWLTVIGVVAHAAHEGLDADARVQLYLLHAQQGYGNMAVVVRTVGRPTDAVPAVRQAMYSVDPDQPIADVRAMDERMADAVGQRKLTMTLLGAFAALALLLASLGIYGVMSHLVAQRAQELGMRMALGARAGDLLRLVLREGMALVAVGAVIGIVGSVGLTQFIQSQLFGVQATDPVALAVVVAVLGITAFTATCLPAYRATRLDPVRALRQE